MENIMAGGFLFKDSFLEEVTFERSFEWWEFVKPPGAVNTSF